MTARHRVLRVITGLDRGGAEESLRKLIGASADSPWQSIVVSLGDAGVVGPEIAREGVEVVELRLSRDPSPARLWRLIRLIRAWRPDIIEGWMVHGNLAAYALSFAAPNARVIWNTRSALPEPGGERSRTMLLVRLAAFLSSRVAAIVYNSNRGADEHRLAGYCYERALIIPNGFDIANFTPTEERRTAMRKRLGAENALVVGHVSRWHPHKDHATLLDAFALLRRTVPSARLVLAGDGLTSTNADLRAQIEHRGLADHVSLLGPVQSTHELYPAFDVFALTSLTEGFPNVLGEALACGVPCVATDAGESSAILTGVGITVDVGDIAAMAASLALLLRESPDARARRSAAGRERVVQRFSLQAMAERYLMLYEDVLRNRRRIA